MAALRGEVQRGQSLVAVRVWRLRRRVEQVQVLSVFVGGDERFDFRDALPSLRQVAALSRCS